MCQFNETETIKKKVENIQKPLYSYIQQGTYSYIQQGTSSFTHQSWIVRMERQSQMSYKRKNKMYSNILENCAASIFRVTELRSGHYWSDWDEESSSLYS
jgi:hypothetical protein